MLCYVHLKGKNISSSCSFLNSMRVNVGEELTSAFFLADVSNGEQYRAIRKFASFVFTVHRIGLLLKKV